MVTVIDFVVELLTSVVNLVLTFVFDVFLGVDPLSAVAFLFGAGFVLAASAVFGYLTVGALVNALTGFGSSAREPSPRRRA
ncbi:hypothetical protein SAMN04487947_2980 [Halogeometricum rufum]|uniref:Uncharacterized protein n=1 Tax=Halogeometricum rufum TaxID=553469 RepID=A0A1I6I773_9EURY|nr:hypothetical protein [Halogeometricum rufum]SFR62504.1 hypothetical protein SAMN04487947_2980 [Halogeometricum rufum]